MSNPAAVFPYAACVNDFMRLVVCYTEEATTALDGLDGIRVSSQGEETGYG
ncbi:hypothetical protein CFI03_022705 [Paenibacillus sp. ATY16]|nr:hypothetical protein [Paenibacillus sp. ATY16]